MNKQQLAAKIWESANKMRSKIEANEYKDYILGFIFYKFLSEKEVKYLKNNDWTDEYLPELKEEDMETVTSIRKNLGYYISYENLFSTWLSKGKDFSVQDVHDALSAFSRLINPTHKKVFEGIFDTLQTGLSKLGDSAASQSKSISDLIYLIKDIPMDGKQGYDVLGFIYEYLIEKFAANAGKKAGEFYTPHEVSLLMSEIVAEHLKNREKIEIYDPTSGSASLLINIGKSASKYIEGKNKIKYYAQELKQNTYNLTRMNLVMRGIEADNIVTRNGDTLEDDWPYFDENDPTQTYNPLYVDAVVSNPPYSQAWNSSDKETDPRYAGYGLAPKGKADYAFLLHDLYHIKPDGIMNIVLPHGVLFRGGEEGQIRKNLIENNKIDAIIGLPANIFYGTGIPTIVMVLKQKRDNTDVLIIDASRGFVKEGKNNKLRASDIKKIVDVVTCRETKEKFSRVVSRDEIRRNDYNLNIPRYVDSSEKAESWDIYASMFGGLPISEINELKEYWTAFPTLKTALLEKTSGEYSRIVVTDIKKAVKENECVQAFEKNFKNAFGNFDNYLYNKLIEKMDTLGISKTEEVLSLDIFARLKDIPLVDKYEAYQLLDDDWTKIAIDLEIIQTEGFKSTKVVDPNMVVKKKGNLEQEVQEGWKGRIIPFDLVQNTLLLDEKQEIQKKENRLSEITSKYEELFDMLTEEEKEADFVNEDSFVFAEVKKALKNKDIEPETKEKLKEVETLNTEEKALRSEVKKESALLEEKTKKTIESLSDEQVRQLLKGKWIHPLIQNLMQLPDRIVSELVDKLKALAKKYETTFAEIESQIEKTEKELSLMIDDLEAGEFDMLGLHEFKKLLGGE
ncbi:MAG: type I restriction-modification system subunit M [Lachnoanaerobaculum sp.]|nr:type I restriction-modification system subunit M [Lachnoanaerobaculum sp.]